MRAQPRQFLAVETLPVPDDRHIGAILYVTSERRFYAGYRDSAGLPQWTPVGASGP